MEVLQDERELALTGVVLALGYLLHRARRRVPEEGPVVGEAVVVAGQAEEEGESDDVNGGRYVPAEDGQGSRARQGPPAADA